MMVERFLSNLTYFLLTCNFFENHPLSIRQSILNIISKILQSFSDEIYQLNRYIKQEILDSLLEKEKPVSPLNS